MSLTAARATMRTGTDPIGMMNDSSRIRSVICA